MSAFQYKHGDRPLEGYCVQRAVGRGGFGEVYYAVSDGGREVALKVIQGYEQIELRGVGQCMNLKSPHLVTIFDVKHNEQGTPFVIMEYVSGPSLRELLSESPSGLGVQKAAFFLREIAKGLTFLHDRGIVHRDLKPGNIFYEDGYVKIGDYGLSKAMSASQHSAQTITVGTVHYMAPEIGKGRYDRSIDIYALGVLLYELLTGQVPFFGSSHGEILMKHLTAEPDLTDVEEPFASVIRKAMAKDPADRFQSVQEMVEAVFGAEHIQQSVSHFRPESLSMVAGRVAERVAVGGPGSSAQHAGGYAAGPRPGQGSSQVWQQVEGTLDKVGQRIDAVGDRLARLGDRFGGRTGPGDAAPGPGAAPVAREIADQALDPSQRRYLWLLTTAVMGVGTAALAGGGQFEPTLATILFTTLSIAGASAMVARVRQAWHDRVPEEPGLAEKLLFGGSACLGALAGSMVVLVLSKLTGLHVGLVPDGIGAILVGFLLIDWPERTDPRREERVSLGSAISAGICGFVLTWLLDGSAVLVIGILAGTSMAVQVAVAFNPKGRSAAPPDARKPERPAWHTRWGRGHGKGGPPPLPGAPEAAEHGADMRTPASAQTSPPAATSRVLPGIVRFLIFVASLFLIGLGLILLIWAGMDARYEEVGAAVAFGLGAWMFAVFGLIRATKKTFASWWSGFVKPVLMLICVQSAFASLMVLSTARHLYDEDVLIGLCFIIFPAILFVVLAFISNRMVGSVVGSAKAAVTPPPAPVALGISNLLRLWAMLLACGGLLGVCGLHRFYVGKIGTGVLWLFTGGLCGVGQVYDIVMIAMGRFTDRHGRPLIAWQDFSELKNAPPATIVGPHPGPASPAADAIGAQVPAGQVASPASEPLPPPAGAVTDPVRPVPYEVPSQWRRIRPGRVVLSMLGLAIVFVAMVPGLFAALHVPEMIAAGIPDPQLAGELSYDLGYSEWPDLLERLANGAFVVLMTLAFFLLLLARRDQGAAHVSRAALAQIALILSVWSLGAALDHIPWAPIADAFNAGRPGPAIQMYLDGAQSKLVLLAAGLFAASSMLIGWPLKHDGHPSRAGEPTSRAQGGDA